MQLKEIEGSLLDGQIIDIDASGMINGSLRQSKDGETCFGTVKIENEKIINDFILNLQNNKSNLLTSTVFKIFFDSKLKQYFLECCLNKQNETYIFIKLEQKFVKSEFYYRK